MKTYKTIFQTAVFLLLILLVTPVMGKKTSKNLYGRRTYVILQLYFNMSKTNMEAKDIHGEHEIKYMQDALVRDVALRLCSEDGKEPADALFTIYMSDTYLLLSDERSKLYTQSAVYVYDCLQRELKYGQIYG